MSTLGMNLERVVKKSFSLPLRCNYLLWAPEEPDENSLLVVTLHGHAMTPEHMLELTAPMVGDRHYIASLQGPYQLWVNNGVKTRSRVAFHWATNYEAGYSRRMHHDMILRVLGAVGLPAARTVLIGFSQSVSLNYRFICTHPEAVGGAIGICGGVPGDWEEGAYQATDTSVLHIAAREDEFYPPELTERYPERLRKYISDLEFHMVEGGHRIPTSATPIVQNWLNRG